MSSSTCLRRSKSNGLVRYSRAPSLIASTALSTAAYAGHQDHFAAGHRGADLPQQVEAVHVGHPQVDHREVGRLAHQRAHRVGAARAGDDVEPDSRGEPLEDFQHRQFVVDDEEQRAATRQGSESGSPSLSLPSWSSGTGTASAAHSVVVAAISRISRGVAVQLQEPCPAVSVRARANPLPHMRECAVWAPAVCAPVRYRTPAQAGNARSARLAIGHFGSFLAIAPPS